MNATMCRAEEGRSLVEPHPLNGITELSTITGAAQFLARYLVGAAGVYSKDAHRLLGIVTERDVTSAVAEGRDPDRTCVVEIMSSDLVTAEAPVTLDEARALMEDAHVRHLIVRRRGGDHIVSLRDLVPAGRREAPRPPRDFARDSIPPGRHRPWIV